jgi:glycerophosphoryl diester phosphodiesterase
MTTGLRFFLPVAVLLGSTAFAAQAPRSVKVHGHRGSRGTRPENTLAAFAEALRVGADVLELDMVVTKDDVVVVSHNPAIPPELCLEAGGGKLAAPVLIRSLTLAQVKSYDCGSLPNPSFPEQVRFPGEKMPTLDEVFEFVERSTIPAAANVEFNIETKIIPGAPEQAPDPARFVALVAALIEKHKIASRTILESFDDRTLSAMKKRLPKVRTALLTSDNHFDFVVVAHDLDADIISPDSRWITKDDVERLHRAGVQVHPWTVDDEAGWAKMLELGVDGIITDYPEKLIAYLKVCGLPRK